MSAKTIEVKVLYFGAAAEIAGRREEILTLPPGATTQHAFSTIASAHPQLLERFAASLRLAVNEEYVSDEIALKNADELAIFPPVSGG